MDLEKGEAYEREAARPLPSAMPPAATTITGCPVKGLFAFLHKSTQAGMRMENGVSPVCPPPSPPCAQMISTPGKVFVKLKVGRRVHQEFAP